MFAGVTVPRLGAEGFASGSTETRGAEAEPVPAAFSATTETKYVVSLLRPVISHAVLALEQLASAVVELAVAWALAVYCVMLAPPVEAGADQDTSARALPEATLTAVGAPGTVRGVAERASETALGPEALTARSSIVAG